MSEKTMKKFMLLDAYSTRTLACVRSFGQHGIPFVAGGHTRWDMSLYSRYCRESFVYTSPYVSISRFLADIDTNIKKFGAEIVLPTSEAAIMACDLYRKQIDAELLAPSREQIDTLFQKRRTLALAQSIGVPIPRTYVVNAENLPSLPELEIPLPAIIKANNSDSIAGDRVVRGGSTVYVYSHKELVEKARKKLAHCPEILVQEFINGYGVGVSGIFKKGEAIALFGHRRIRESNPLGGPSAVAVSIPISKELRDSTVKILRKTGYTGAAMVEYKIDRTTGKSYLMEINGRLWGSILLPVAAGLDLPYILWKVANDEDVAPAEISYREGVVGRNLLGDTRHLASVLRGKPKKWPGHFPGKWEAVCDYTSLFFAQSQSLLLVKDDPKPAFGRLLQELFA